MRSSAAVSAPCSARSLTVAAPSPRDPPVTRATLPVSGSFILPTSLFDHSIVVTLVVTTIGRNCCCYDRAVVTWRVTAEGRVRERQQQVDHRRSRAGLDQPLPAPGP